MDLSKSLEFFNPMQITDSIHIVGLGAIGSTLAINLARLGVEKLYIYDPDTVSNHNLANQQYRYEDVGARKVDAITSILKEINPRIQVNKTNDYWSARKPLSGYVFMCMDNMRGRNDVFRHCRTNDMVKAVFDFRMGLADAQAYAAVMESSIDVEKFNRSLQFTDEEAKKNVPVSACNTELSIYPTVATIVSLGVANFINHIKGQPVKNLILLDTFAFTIDAL